MLIALVMLDFRFLGWSFQRSYISTLQVKETLSKRINYSGLSDLATVAVS